MRRSSLSTVIFERRDCGKARDSGKEAVTGVTPPVDSQLSGSDRHMSAQSVCQTYGTYGTHSKCDKMNAAAPPVPFVCPTRGNFQKAGDVMIHCVSNYTIANGKPRFP